MPRKLSPCGTTAAAKRHRRNDEPLCDECRAAEQDEKNERAAQKREDSRVKVDVDSMPGESLDELAELRRMYTVLTTHMGDAPPQSIAAIVRQADAVLVRIKEIEGNSSEQSGGLLDGLPAPSAVPSNVVRFPGAQVANG